jgi:hypothetical protein
MEVSGLKLNSVETGFKGQKLGQVKLDLALMVLQLVLKFVHLYKHQQGTLLFLSTRRPLSTHDVVCSLAGDVCFGPDSVPRACS